jgi:hypothetical protein
VFVELWKGRVLVLYRGYDNVEELQRGHIQHHRHYNGHYSKVRVRKSTVRPRIMKDALALALEGHGTCRGGFAYSSRIYQRNAL